LLTLNHSKMQPTKIKGTSKNQRQSDTVQRHAAKANSNGQTDREN
jgi:hypothetical protein